MITKLANTPSNYRILGINTITIIIVIISQSFFPTSFNGLLSIIIGAILTGLSWFITEHVANEFSNDTEDNAFITYASLLLFHVMGFFGLLDQTHSLPHDTNGWNLFACASTIVSALTINLIILVLIHIEHNHQKRERLHTNMLGLLYNADRYLINVLPTINIQKKKGP